MSKRASKAFGLPKSRDLKLFKKEYIQQEYGMLGVIDENDFPGQVMKTNDRF